MGLFSYLTVGVDTTSMKLKYASLILFAFLLVNSEAAKKRGGGKKKKPCPARCACKAPKSEPACKEKAVDLVFVLDGSSSVGPKNFTVVQNFINGIVDKFSVSPGGVKIGLLQYSTSPRIEFNLNDHKTKKSVKAAVKNIDWILGDTHTALAFRETHNSMVAPAYRKESKRSRFVIVITDGDPQDFKQVPAAVDQLTGKGVKIFAIGVGKATRSELKKLAFTGEHSNTKEVFYADNYADAKRFTNTLVSLICKNVE